MSFIEIKFAVCVYASKTLMIFPSYFSLMGCSEAQKIAY